MNTLKTILAAIGISLLTGCAGSGNPDVPGTVIDHSPASSGKYIGSPSICILDDGTYIASDEYFGPAVSGKQHMTFVYKSSDKGKRWKRISTIRGQTWSQLFTLNDTLYIIGPAEEGGDVVIRRSTDGGHTWTEPVDSFTGRIFRGRCHSAPTPVLVHNGRVWKGIEDMDGPTGRWARNFRAFVISAPAGSDLLQAGNWTSTNPLGYNPEYLEDKYGGWLEGNAVAGPDGTVYDILRTDYRENGYEKAAVLSVSPDGKVLDIDPQTAFVDMPGACKKFSIKYDETSGLYWTIANYVPDIHKDGNPERTRNTAALMYSSDLKKWDVKGIVLYHPDPAKCGFQYIDYQFDGDDIIAVSRTAFDDGLGGADNQHNANYFTFHRIKDFRNYRTLEEWSELMPGSARRKVTVMDSGWSFTRGDSASYAFPGTDVSGWETVTVPHDWAIAGPFDMSIDAQKVTVAEDGEKVPKTRTGRSGALPWIGTGWYRKVLPASLTRKGRIHTLEFDGAMSNASVYVNGEFAGKWAYGYSSFSVDITDFLDYGKENLIAVRLENKPESSRWYPGAGLYRNVRLVSTDSLRIPVWGTCITTPEVSAGEASVCIRTTVANAAGSGRDFMLVTEILDENDNCIAKDSVVSHVSEEATLEQMLDVKAPLLWSIETPHLYTARSTVSSGGEIRDVCKTRFGIRSTVFDPDRGFFLNGEKVQIKGVCMHHDLGPLGAAVNRRGIERQLEILKEMGCNAIRTAHNPPAPELLDLCDEMGFVVMVESFDEWKIAKNANGYNTLFDEWAEADIMAMIHRDRNHPCVIMWSIGNEIREQAVPEGSITARRLTDICHREDPTRPVTAGLNNYDLALKHGFAGILDVLGFNYKPFAYGQVHRDYPDIPILGAETASTVSSRGIYHFPPEETGLGRDDEPLWDDFQCSSYDLVYPAWASTPDTEFEAQEDCGFVLGEFVWTGFDYLGEPTPYNDNTPARSSYFGIMDLAGMKKDRFYLYQSIWSDTPVLHILPHWNWTEGDRIPVFCYTNYDKVELFLNGRSLGIKSKNQTKKEERFRIVWNDVIFEAGELKAVAYDRSGRKAATTVVKTAGEPAGITAIPDRKLLHADGKDLAYVEISIVDKDGELCPDAVNMLKFDVDGNGVLEAVCNGDPTSHISFKSHAMPAFSGKCMAIVRNSGTPGKAVLTVSSPRLGKTSVAIEAK